MVEVNSNRSPRGSWWVKNANVEKYFVKLKKMLTLFRKKRNCCLSYWYCNIFRLNDFFFQRPKTPWWKLFTSIPVYALAYALFGQMWALSHFLSVHPSFLGTILHYPIEQVNFLYFLHSNIEIRMERHSKLKTPMLVHMHATTFLN